MILHRIYHRLLPFLLAALGLAGCQSEPETVALFHAERDTASPARSVLFLAGPDSHGPLAHEHRAGSELLARELHRQHPGYRVEVIYGGWPLDESVLDGIDSLVIYCDGGKGHLINKHLPRFRQLLDASVGVVTLHYAVEVPKDGPSANAVLHATGGYFETHWSVNPHWEAQFTTIPTHPVTSGIQPFRMNDEWYFNMRFQPAMAGITPLLLAVPPAETMERGDGPHSGNPAVRDMVARGLPQVTAWAYERPGGGRGFGYTGGHYHANWDEANARQLVINAIAWTAEGHR